MTRAFSQEDYAAFGVQFSGANSLSALQNAREGRPIPDTFMNGIQGAVNGQGFQFSPLSTQLSQVDTLFRNNRWYLLSNMRQVLSELYVEHGLVQTVIDVPVNDALRGGLIWKSKQLGEVNIQELQDQMEREDDIKHIGYALKWNRLFGGAGLIVMTDQDFAHPLVIDDIGEDSRLLFRPADMWELSGATQNTEVYEPALLDYKAANYTFYGHPIHKSRVLRMKGLEAPSFIRPRLRGWGFSVLESLVRSVNQYLKSTDLTFEVLDEYKVDVLKIKNLANLMTGPGGKQAVIDRIQFAMQQKNYQNALAMDSEDDYQQKQLSFTGLSDVQLGIRIQIGSDLKMPLTKIFGISATGFNSGEDDIENYNAMVESTVRQPAKADILAVGSLRCQQLFGFIPDDLAFEYQPLRVLSSEQQENVRTQKFNRVLAARSAGELTTKEFRDACNKDDLLGIKLDTTDAALTEIEDEQEAQDEENEESSESPGSGGGAGGKSSMAAKETKEVKNSIGLIRQLEK